MAISKIAKLDVSTEKHYASYPADYLPMHGTCMMLRNDEKYCLMDIQLIRQERQVISSVWKCKAALPQFAHFVDQRAHTVVLMDKAR